MARGQKHGFGTMWRCEHGKHRVEYNGTWVHNRRDGYGVMHNDKGETYEGMAQREEARAR